MSASARPAVLLRGCSNIGNVSGSLLLRTGKNIAVQRSFYRAALEKISERRLAFGDF